MQKKHRIKVSQAYLMKLKLIERVMQECIEKGIEDWPPYKEVLKEMDIGVQSL